MLDTLTPANGWPSSCDMFAVPFREIAPIVGRSAQATKMLASRARHRVGASAMPSTDRHRQRAVVDAFLAASRNGDFAALLDLLDPDVTVRVDASAATPGTPTASAAPVQSRGRRWISRTGPSTPTPDSSTAFRRSW